MSFNLDPRKRVKKLIFSRKVNKASHPPLMFKSNIVYQVTSRKRLGIILDNCLSFEEHLKLVFSKINKSDSSVTKTSMPHPKIRASYYL